MPISQKTVTITWYPICDLLWTVAILLALWKVVLFMSSFSILLGILVAGWPSG